MLHTNEREVLRLDRLKRRRINLRIQFPVKGKPHTIFPRSVHRDEVQLCLFPR